MSYNYLQITHRDQIIIALQMRIEGLNSIIEGQQILNMEQYRRVKTAVDDCRFALDMLKRVVE